MKNLINSVTYLIVAVIRIVENTKLIINMIPISNPKSSAILNLLDPILYMV